MLDATGTPYHVYPVTTYGQVQALCAKMLAESDVRVFSFI